MSDSPPPFNPEYREGFAEALSERYKRWSIANPEHTKEEGQIAYRQFADALMPLYPSVKEKA